MNFKTLIFCFVLVAGFVPAFGSATKDNLDPAYTASQGQADSSHLQPSTSPPPFAGAQAESGFEVFVNTAKQLPVIFTLGLFMAGFISYFLFHASLWILCYIVQHTRLRQSFQLRPYH